MLGYDKLSDAVNAYTNICQGNVGRSSVDVTLGENFWYIKQRSSGLMDLRTVSRENLEEYFQLATIENGEFYLFPGQFVRAELAEEIEMPSHLSAMFTLRSIYAQLGLDQATSVWARPSWCGRLILELMNVGPNTLILRPGLPIGQLHFFEVNGGTP